MKLLSFTESDKEFQKNGNARVSIQVIGNKGLLYKRYKEDAINIENNEFTFLIQHLKEGDSSSFMVSKTRIENEFSPIKFNETTSDFVEVIIKVHRFYTKSEYLLQQQSYDKELMEQLILSKYLNEIDKKISKQGIYVQQLKKGKGKKIKKGDVITIGYTGYFINRLEFDKISGSTAFTFIYGTPGQIIRGLAIAINGMKKGEKSKIIIPSHLAFGEGGSTTKVVPPYTTVIYELEIVNVK